VSWQHLAWAYEIDVKGPAKAVLVSLADQADSEGSCFPGQALLAKMTGYSVKTIERSLKRLEDAGLITRIRRNTADGYRTSDRFYLHPEVTTYSEVGAAEPDEEPQDLTDNKSGRAEPGLTDSQSGLPDSLTGQREVPSLDPPENPPATPVAPTALAVVGAPKPAAVVQIRRARRADADLDPADAVEGTRFADFWQAYPRHDDRRRAENAWKSARRRADPAEIVAGAARYRDDPNREQAFTKQPATWLNADAWGNDPLPARNGRAPENAVDRRNRQVEEMRARLAARDQPTQQQIGDER
jgi:biotin operon repressor